MARSSGFAIAAGCVVVMALPSSSAIGPDTATQHLDRAARLLLAPSPARQDMTAGFLSLLDALIDTAPDEPSAAACQPKLTKARELASQDSILAGGVVELLRECYRDAHGGASFRPPGSVRSRADAVAYCGSQLRSARHSLERGRRNEAFARMIDAAVFIVTPVERNAGGSEAWFCLIGRWWTAVRAIFLERFAWLSTVRSSSSG